MPIGWVVAVEHEDGDVLYVVAVDNPVEAERVVFDKLKVPASVVSVIGPADSDTVERFSLKYGDLKGPM